MQNALSATEINAIVSYYNAGGLVVLVSDGCCTNGVNANAVLAAMGTSLRVNDPTLGGSCSVSTEIDPTHCFMTGITSIGFGYWDAVTGGQTLFGVQGFAEPDDVAQVDTTTNRLVVVGDSNVFHGCVNGAEATFGANLASCNFGCSDATSPPSISGCQSSPVSLNTSPSVCCATHTFPTPAASDPDACASLTGPILSGRPSGSCFNNGESVTFSVSDSASQTASCSWTYAVTDNESPRIDGTLSSTPCPNNIVSNTDLGSCSAVVVYTNPIGTDNCPGVSTGRTAGLSSGSTFPLGSTTQTFVATDAQGLTSSCSFSVTVNDNQSPVIDGTGGSTACPSSITRNNDAGQCSAVVTYTPPVGADNCSGVTTSQLGGLVSGSPFPVGSTTNVFQAQDGAGNLSTSCSFVVTVLDNEAPSITCPSDIALNTEPGVCTAVATYTVLSTDNCPGETRILNAGLASGSAFPLGTTVVQYIASDASSNTSPPCNFNVVVTDNQAPTIVCPADITVNASVNGCSAQVTFMFTVTDNCPATVITSTHNSGDIFSGVTDVTATATDSAGNFDTCTFRITVVDTISPTISCYSAAAVTDPGVCSATVFFRDPDAFDVCGVSIDQTGNAISGQTYAPGTYTSTFTATDPSNNRASCTSTITVTDAEAPVVTGCPSDIIVANPAGCDEIVTWDDSGITSADNCGVVSTGQSHASGDSFPRGLTPVSYTATDAAGNVGQCSFVVRVVDSQRVSFNDCPLDISVPSSCSDSGTQVSWQAPSIDAACLSYQSLNFQPGTRFPDGVTTISYVAVADEEYSTCLFDITVEPCAAEDGANRPPGAIGTIDLDGDGYYSDAPLLEWRDCCDSPEDPCDDPYLVNPGAYEIAANDQQDSCRGTTRSGRADVDGHIGGCDREFISANDYQLVGPTIPSEQTNEAVWALDLCEFKEDDDDPSWGFDEQETMVFSLANGTRNGYDIGIVGPAMTQAAVVDHYGGIVPARGDFMLAMSTGTARDQATAGHLPPMGATTGNSIVNLPASFLDSDASTFVEDCGGLPYAVGVDSIRAHFRMRQPTNMNAFSFQALYMDYELEAAQGSYPALGGTCDSDRKSWFLAIKTDSKTGVSGNFAGDATGRSFNSFNANPGFWSQCNDYGDFSSGLCRDGSTSLEMTGFTGASNWTPIGTSAEPGETFSLEFVTFDGQDGANDATVLLDDFFPITEARTGGSSAWASHPWGYQYTADLEMVHFALSGGSPLLSKSVTSATLEFTLRNWGPEEANDVTIGFTPPLGASFTAAKDSNGASLSCTTQPASSPYEDNGFVKCKWPTNEPLPNQATRSGSVAFAIDLNCAACPRHTTHMRFRLTSTLSSIDRQLSNNYLTVDATFV